MMEIVRTPPNGLVTKAVLFDFDGTISTLRFGWEGVMRPLMCEHIGGPAAETARLVDEYIDESTGIQTIFQMKWLAGQIAARGGPVIDPWTLKAEYNERLMEEVAARRDDVAAGRVPRENYLIAGAEDFLIACRAAGLRVFVASGTDDTDVRREAEALGVYKYFDACKGAPAGREDCSKEAALRALIEESGLKGGEIAVFGDGKVEIELAKAAGARAFGMATDEAARRGINPRKRAKLIRAGADVVAGDFRDINGLFGRMGLNGNRRTDETATVDFLRERIMALVRHKGWGDENGIQHPQRVAMAMTVEMSELLEHFQWLEEKQVQALRDGEDQATLEGINEELADVFIYGLQLSKALRIDVADAILRKLEIVAGRDYSQEAPR